MDLTKKQRRHLRKFNGKKTVQELAFDLNVSAQELGQYLEKNIPETGLKKKILDFDFHGWFKENRLVIITLVVLVFLAYYNSLNNGFVSDDVMAISENKNLDNFSYVWSSPQTFVRNLSYYTINKIWGLNPLPYRLVGILSHLGMVLASYLLVWIMLDPLTAAIAAGLFAVHPILVESVAWISGGLYAQYGFFIVLAVLFYLFSVKNKRFYPLSLFSFLLALSVSEKAVIFPIILLMLILYSKDTFGAKSWKKLIIPFSISLGWTVLYFLMMPKRLASSPYANSALNPFSQPVSVFSYLKLIFWPDKLTPYPLDMLIGKAEYQIYLLLSFLLLAAIVLAYRKRSQIFFWLSLFMISLIPVLTPFRVASITAERYAYLGTLGIVVIVAFLLKKLAEKAKLKTAVLIFCSLLVIGLLARTIVRNKDWQSQDALWLADIKNSPSSAQNHNNMGSLYARQGDFEAAIQEFKMAIRLKPYYAEAFYNLATAYRQSGKTDLAIDNYKMAAILKDSFWEPYSVLALIYSERNDFQTASQYLEKAIGINPQNAKLHFRLGTAYSALNEKEKAEAEFQKAIELDPSIKDLFSS